MTDTININTPGGETTLSKTWLKNKLTENLKITTIGETIFVYDEESNCKSWSLLKRDYDMIMAEIRDDKINSIIHISV
jgi:hypothetical protein